MVVDRRVFQDKRVEMDFQNVFAQIAQMQWHTLIDPYRYAYLQGYEAGRAREREHSNSPKSESIETPKDASVR